MGSALTDSETRRAMATLRRAAEDQRTVARSLASLPPLPNAPAVALWAQETLRGILAVLGPVAASVAEMDARKGDDRG